VTARQGDNQTSATFMWDTANPGLITRKSSGDINKTYAYGSTVRQTTVTTTIEDTTYKMTTQYDSNYGKHTDYWIAMLTDFA
jgi:hypothetical protein